MAADDVVRDSHHSSEPDRDTPYLYQELKAQAACATVLQLLHRHPTTLMTTADIAASVRLSLAETEGAISILQELGLLREILADQTVFYGMTYNEERLASVRRFLSWCAQQRETWDHLCDVVQD
jgi:hypothetical protein